MQTDDPMFSVIERTHLTQQDIAALASGTCAAVRMPHFLTEESCTAVLTAVDHLAVGHYDADRVPTRIARFGPALNDYRRTDGQLDADWYWPAVEAARHGWHRAAITPDPIAASLTRLATAWGSPPAPATIQGRPVFGGTLREINDGALIHNDEIVREFPGLFDHVILAQLAFNLWVAVPDQGGQTTVWRRRWDPADDANRTAYGFHGKVVQSCQHITTRPERPGEALLFNPTHMHAVEPAAGRRVAFAFFLGLTATGQLVYWS